MKRCPCPGWKHIEPCSKAGKPHDATKGRKRSPEEYKATDAKRVRMGSASPRLREHVQKLVTMSLEDQERAADALDAVFARDGGGRDVY